MAAVDFFTGFSYKWAQDGSIYNWDDSQYKQGWATIGSVPPSVEQFNRTLQIADEKSNWLFAQLQAAAAEKGVTLSASDLDGLKKTLQEYAPNATESTRGIMEIATANEAQALTDDERALTPKKLSDAFKGANNSFASNSGFQRFPGGLILQMGFVQGFSGYTITLPTAFPVGPIGQPIASCVGTAAVSGTAAYCETSPVVGNQFKIFTYVAASGGGSENVARSAVWYCFGR